MNTDKDYSQIFEINIQKVSNNISQEKIKHINLAIKELNSWCDLFIQRRDNTKDRQNYFNSLNDKPIADITKVQIEEEKFFKDEEEVKKMIIYNWFAYLLRYRLPRFCDGKTLRKYRRELYKELSSGKLVTKNSIEALNRCFEKLKNI